MHTLYACPIKQLKAFLVFRCEEALQTSSYSFLLVCSTYVLSVRWFPAPQKDGSDAVLRQLCSPEVLPTDLGGACAYPEPVENVVLRQRQQQAGASSSGGQQQAGGSNPFAGAAS